MSKYFSLFYALPLFASGDIDIISSKPIKAEDAIIWKELDEMDKSMQQIMGSLKKQIEEDKALMTHATPASRITMQVDEEGDYIIITLAGVDVADQTIEMRAKENNLDGAVATASGGTVRFKVINGRYVELAYTREVKKVDDKEGKQIQQYMATTSNQGEYLPVAVDNLEEAIVTFKDNQLVVKLPKHNPKKDWKKIKVQ